MTPWLPYLLIDFIEHYLKPEMEVFEWGSGGSTIWFSERAERVISIEHNQEWFNKVEDRQNVTRRLIEPSPGAIKKNKSDPLSYYSECLGDVNLTDYAKSIEAYDKFDLILVDGRARPSCLFHAYKHLKTGGWLVLDNTDRHYYLSQTEFLFEGWDKVSFLGYGPNLGYQWPAILWRKNN